MTQGLTKSEVTALTKISPSGLRDSIRSAGDALKLSGYEFSTIFDIVLNIHKQEETPKHFSIINNRYLTFPESQIYDLVECESVSTPQEDKLMAITFWI